MYHSVNYGDKNTWDDWNLVPSTRPLFDPPSVKTQYVDIPGKDSKTDLTEAVRGYPLYNNRTGSHEFLVVNDFYEPVENSDEWYVRYSKIMNYLHGKKMKVNLEDDPEYYYEGRFSVNAWKSDKYMSTITINYDVGPYKWSKKRSDEPWEWDTFNFQNGVITSGLFEIEISDEARHYLDFEREMWGYAPVVPMVYIANSSGLGPLNGTKLHVDFTYFISGSIHTDNIQEDIVCNARYARYTPQSLIFKGGNNTSLLRVSFRFTFADGDSGPYKVKLVFRRGSF